MAMRSITPDISSLKASGNKIIQRVSKICCFGATNRSPNDLGVAKYIKVKTKGDITPWTEEELVGLPAALAVEKMYHEQPDYFTHDNFDLFELYTLAYLHGVANCEGMAACAYIEARKMGFSPIRFVRFNPTSSSTTTEELNCIIIYRGNERLLVNPWDGIVCIWPNSNNINDAPELSEYHGHSMEIRKEAHKPPTELISFSKSSYDLALKARRQQNLEQVKQKALSYPRLISSLLLS